MQLIVNAKRIIRSLSVGLGVCGSCGGTKARLQSGEAQYIMFSKLTCSSLYVDYANFKWMTCIPDVHSLQITPLEMQSGKPEVAPMPHVPLVAAPPPQLSGRLSSGSLPRVCTRIFWVSLDVHLHVL